MVRATFAALALSLLLGGCLGGGSSTTRSDKRLSPADRVAYYQIATTVGLLRGRASSLLNGLNGTPRSALREARARLGKVRPGSATLTKMKGALERALDDLLSDESRTSAQRAIRAAKALSADLTAYSRGKAVTVILPD